MEKKIVVSRRFRKNTLALFEYLRKKFSEKTAVDFLERLEQRTELIILYPEIGKPSQFKPDIRT